MMHLLGELFVFAVAAAVAAAAGRRSQRKFVALRAAHPEAFGRMGFSAYADFPILAGVLAGGICLLFLGSQLLAEDRFVSRPDASRIVIAVLLGAILIGHAQGMALTLMLARRLSNRKMVDAAETEKWVKSFQAKWRYLQFLVEVFAAILVVSAGVRFHVLSVPSGGDLELGSYAAALTVLWIVAAINFVKLLGGLDGAAGALLLVASGAAYWIGSRAPEPVLRAFAALLGGAAAGSLHFNMHPALLRVTPRGHATVGFLFAVLTVLARQKTIAAVTLILPLFLAIVLLAGAMIIMLNRGTLPPGAK